MFRMAMIRLAMTFLAFTSGAAYASTVYATGFEEPSFTTGSIAGQNGWEVFGSAISTVETFNVYAGSQAVFVDGSAAGQSGPYWADPTPDTNSLIQLSAEIYIASSLQESQWQLAATSPGFGAFIGGIDLVPDMSDPGVDNIELVSGANPVVGTFDLNQWNLVDLVFNMTTQTYSLSVNGTTLTSDAAFCGSTVGCSGATIASYGDSLFDVFGGKGGDNDAGFMDNFSLSNVSAVPEPKSPIFLVGAGLALVYAARRTRARRLTMFYFASEVRSSRCNT